MRIVFDHGSALASGTVVQGWWTDELPPLARPIPGFGGAEAEVAVLAAPPAPFEHLIALGMGAHAGLTPVRLRRLGGAALPAIRASRAAQVRVLLELPEPQQAAEWAYGLALRGWRGVQRHRSRPDPDAPPPPVQTILVACTDPQAAQARFQRLEPVLHGVFLARQLADEPGNLLGPEELADAARQLEPLGVTVEVLDPAAHGLRLLAAVGQGSARPPRLVVLHWPGGAADEAPLALVGKGVTFDTGGIAIKPAERMEEMKGDMAGAAAVLGALRAIAGRRARTNVVGVLAVAENMPSGRAVRPGDVVRGHSGHTVEIIDPDAEGRLALADALSYVCARFRPRAVVDAATLTGTVIALLGRHHAGLHATSDRLARQVLARGTAEDEPLWRLPLSESLAEHIASPIADLRHCTWERAPDNDVAALFLSRFVPKSIPWAHLDIAGTADAAEASPLCPKGPTGFGVRLMDGLAGGE